MSKIVCPDRRVIIRTVQKSFLKIAFTSSLRSSFDIFITSIFGFVGFSSAASLFFISAFFFPFPFSSSSSSSTSTIHAVHSLESGEGQSYDMWPSPPHWKHVFFFRAGRRWVVLFVVLSMSIGTFSVVGVEASRFCHQRGFWEEGAAGVEEEMEVEAFLSSS
jgi:hypothetical protein